VDGRPVSRPPTSLFMSPWERVGAPPRAPAAPPRGPAPPWTTLHRGGGAQGSPSSEGSRAPYWAPPCWPTAHG